MHDTIPIAIPETGKKVASSWDLAGFGGIGLATLLMGPYLYGMMFKGKTMTVLENALLNLIGPLIDTLRNVENERDVEKEKNKKLFDKNVELDRVNKELRASNEAFQAEMVAGSERLLGLQKELSECRRIIEQDAGMRRAQRKAAR